MVIATIAHKRRKNSANCVTSMQLKIACVGLFMDLYYNILAIIVTSIGKEEVSSSIQGYCKRDLPILCKSMHALIVYIL